MSQLPLHELLLQRAFGPRNEAFRTAALAITRRQFIQTVGTFGAAVEAMSLHALAPQITRKGRTLIVHYGGAAWPIDAALFGRSAYASWAKRGRDLVLWLRKAHLPGTPFRADFDARLTERTDGWAIQFAMASLDFVATGLLGPWIRDEAPLQGSTTFRELVAGGSQAVLEGPASLAFHPSFLFQFTGSRPGCVQFDGWACTGRQLSLGVQAGAAGSLREAMFGSREPATTFSISDAEVTSDSIPLDAGCDGRELCCSTCGRSTVSGELFSHQGRPEGLVLLDGPLRVRLPSANGDGHQINHIEFENAALLSTLGRPKGEKALAGRVSRAVQTLETNGSQLTVRGDDERPFYARFREGRATDVRFQARLEHAWITVPGADFAALDFSSQPLDIHLSSGASTPAPDTDRVSPSILVLGSHPYVLMQLEPARLTVRRGVDLLNLTFAYEGFDLVVRDGRPVLRRRVQNTNLPCPDRATMTVIFPGQHIAERLFTFEDLLREIPQTGPRFPLITPARLSSPSRIVFDMADGCGPAGTTSHTELPLTIEGLTDWSDLALVVNERAMEPDASFDDQMRVAKIDARTSAAGLFDRVADSLQPPTPSQTALTMAGQLVFSPSRSARWQTPRGPINPTLAPLWHARLDQRGRQTVRAIWSDRLVPGVLGPHPNGDDPLLALKAKDHWQLVAETSLYGLPALRRLDKDGHDLPKSRIVRPPIKAHTGDWCSLVELDTLCSHKHKDAGIAIPKPFDSADIILTPLGGSMVALFSTEPPHLLFPSKDCAAQGKLTAFDLESLEYTTQLARDIRVKAVYKGFTVPHGQRCSFVTLSERRLIKHDVLREPIAIEYQRQFIVFNRPVKMFPCVNQAFAGRDFPADQLVMQTRRTPDLESPEDDIELKTTPYSGVQMDPRSGRLGFDAWPHDPKDQPLVFWPRVARSRLDFDFSWTLDADTSPISSNLIFVSNSVLSNRALVKAVAKYYRELGTKGPESVKDLRLRTASVRGARRRYAPASSAGDTWFDTDSWFMSVRGRLLQNQTPDDLGTFEMDGIMEGADQPPFYPWVENAFINVQSLDRLLGKPQGLIKVAFDPTYVEGGFGTPSNKTDLFLDVISPEIALDVTGQGEATGGLVKPNALVVALSRQIGIVGGTRKAPTDGKARASLRTAGASDRVPARPDTTSPFEFTHAKAGTFNPKEYFGGLGNAKLLGLIPLDFLLEAIGIGGAPKLLESFGYGVLKDAADTGLAGLQSAAAAAGKDVQEPLRLLIKRLDDAPIPGTPIKFVDLYPVLFSKLKGLQIVLDEALTAIAGAPSLPAASTAVASIVTASRDLFAEIERTMRDPVPTAIVGTIENFAVLWQKLLKEAEHQYGSLGRTLRQNATSAFTAFCREVDRHKLADVLFGVDQTLGDEPAEACTYLAENPSDALERAGNSIFAQVLSGPLIQMLADLRALEAEVTGRVAWARRSVRRLATEWIADLAQKLVNDLAADLTPDKQQIVIESILGELAKTIDAAGAPAPFGQSRNDHVNTVLKKLEALKDELKTAVERAIDNNASLLTAATAPPDRLLPNFKAIAPAAVVLTRAAIAQEVAKVRLLTQATAEEARAREVERLLAFARRTIAAALASADVSRIVTASRKVTNWCNETAGDQGAVTFAKTFVGGLVASSDELTGSLQTIEQALRSLELPEGASPQARDVFNRAVAAAKVALARVADGVAAADAARTKLVSVANNANVCTAPDQVLRPVMLSVRHRLEAVSAIRDLVEQLAVLDAADLQRTGISLSSASTITDAINELGKAVSGLLRDVTSIAKIGATPPSPEWATALAASDRVRSLVGSLEDERLRLVNRSKGLSNALQQSPIEVRRLRDLANEVLVYAREHDKQVAALVLQTIAATDDLASTLQASAKDLLLSAIMPLVALHEVVGQALGSVVDLLAENNIVKLIVNKDVVATLKTSQGEIQADLDTLRAIQKLLGSAGAGDVKAGFAKVQELVDCWNKVTPALARVTTTIADLAAQLVRGDPTALLNASELRAAVSDFAGLLEDKIRAFIPTSVHLSYAWSTPIRPFPGDSPIFSMVESAPDDLALTVDASMELVSGSRSSRVGATLRPFRVWLLGKDIDIARITFAGTPTTTKTGQTEPVGATFTSTNGGAPHFDARVSNVELGEAVAFIEPLQDWLSPGGSGFYVKPLQDRAGIEAGFEFNADVISLGALSFINVGLTVGAQLPLSDYPALFLFSFGSPERPFLISALPAYGGGGYVSLLANASGIVGFSLLFMAGAVVAIKFGPLRAHGRVTAGIYVIRREDTRRIGALVEAVGQGHIACFGISVCLRIGLEDNGGTLSGYATFTFDFKVGFATVSFSFTAGKEIPNKTGGPFLSAAGSSLALSPLLECPLKCSTGTARYECKAPIKATRWAEYRKRLATELLVE